MEKPPNMENEYNPDMHDWDEETKYLNWRHSEWVKTILDVNGNASKDEQIEKLIKCLIQWVELSVQTTEALLIAEYMLREEKDKEFIDEEYTENYKEKTIFALINSEKNFDAAGLRKTFSVDSISGKISRLNLR